MSSPILPRVLRRALLSALAVAALSVFPRNADAMSIVSADLTPGLTFVDLGFATVTSTNGPFASKTVAGYKSTGVGGGLEGGEIDLHGEIITFVFAQPQSITKLVLANLYAAHEHDDAYNEQALIRVTFAGGGGADYVLSLTSATTATFTGPGTVTNLSPGLFTGGGAWKLTDPFGSAAVKTIQLLAIGPPQPEDMRNNDYGFHSMYSVVAIPEPGGLALVSAGLGGLALFGRRRAS